MKVVVASASAVKLSAVRSACSDQAELIGVAAASGVNAQPVGHETVQGAQRRLANARVIRPDADVYISIENGIFDENGTWVDYPVVIAARAGGAQVIVRGHGVVFPPAAIEAARQQGFATTTVGQTMQASGIVRQHDDPHRDLTGISREDYLIDAVRSALARVAPELQPAPPAKVQSLSGYYRFLSNFWPCRVTYEGLAFANVEAAYHAAKCADPADRAQFAALSAPASKKLGATIAMRADWDAIKRDVMAGLLRQKFADPSLRRLLRQTGACEIVEGNTWDDRFWGVCNGSGENNLGRLLMQVRREGAQTLRPRPPRR